MVPLSDLILLSTVCVVATGAFIFAIYYTIKTRLEPKRLRDAEADSELRTPLRETAADPGVPSRSTTPLSPRPPTPEAEYPPPLPGESEHPTNAAERVQSMRAELSPPPFLPATTYRPPPAISSSSHRPPTTEADCPPPLPRDFPSLVSFPLPPHSPLLPPPLSLPLSINREAPKPHSRSRGRGRSPEDDNQRPEPLPQERPDSMHEIYDIYSQLPPTSKVLPKSAPPNVVTFKQAESKWAYFGERRAESRDRKMEGKKELGTGMNMI